MGIISCKIGPDVRAICSLTPSSRPPAVAKKALTGGRPTAPPFDSGGSNRASLGECGSARRETDRPNFRDENLKSLTGSDLEPRTRVGVKLERESAGGFSEAEERAAWVVGVASADLSAWRGFGRGAAGFAGGWVGGGGDWAGFGDWAARRDLSANAEARKIASLSPSTLL